MRFAAPADPDLALLRAVAVVAAAAVPDVAFVVAAAAAANMAPI